MTRSLDRLNLLALCRIQGVSWHVIAREAQQPNGISRLLAGQVGEDSREGRATRELLASELASLEERAREAAAEIESAAEVGARLVTVLDHDYPANLRLIPKLPPFLFCRGELRREDARSVAVVGTRRASPKGIDRATQLVTSLVEAGVTVVSGLAKGIDAAAHTATLDAGGRTLAVIGAGILHTYPREHTPLAERIARQGAVVSQFWPSAAPTRSSFPIRNEVMSGISQGTAVIEAGPRSGAKMQARLALEQGKRAFLTSALIAGEEWAKSYVDQRGAIEVDSADDAVKWLRSPEQVEAQSNQRHQLAIEIA